MGSSLSALFLDFALQHARTLRQICLGSLYEKSIKPATMFDSAQSIGRNPHPNGASQQIRLQCDIAQIRQEAPLGLAV